MSRVQQHRRAVDAVHLTRRTTVVFGYESAAVVLGISVSAVSASPVHVIVASSSPARSKNGVLVHRQDLRDEDVIQVGDLLVTSPLRTAVDIARARSFRTALVTLDFVVNTRRARSVGATTVEELQEELARSGAVRGGARARRAIDFARDGAANPGESISRAVIHQLGFPTPLLQVRHDNPRGGNYFTDTEWPEHRLIGEFDGKGKYLKEEYLRSMSPGEAVYEEKIREDHLRAEDNRVVRWGWKELRDPPLLEQVLLRGALPRLARPPRRTTVTAAD